MPDVQLAGKMELLFVPLAGKGVGPLQRTQVNVLKVAAGDGMQVFEIRHLYIVQAFCRAS
jgi:hypothetical protein